MTILLPSFKRVIFKITVKVSVCSCSNSRQCFTIILVALYLFLFDSTVYLAKNYRMTGYLFLLKETSYSKTKLLDLL